MGEDLEARVRDLEVAMALEKANNARGDKLRTTVVSLIVAIATGITVSWGSSVLAPQPDPAVTRATKTLTPQGRVVEIIRAIRELPSPDHPDAPMYWTASGEPRVSSISAKVDFPVTATEIAYAWSLIRRE